MTCAVKRWQLLQNDDNRRETGDNFCESLFSVKPIFKVSWYCRSKCVCIYIYIYMIIDVYLWYCKLQYAVKFQTNPFWADNADWSMVSCSIRRNQSIAGFLLANAGMWLQNAGFYLFSQCFLLTSKFKMLHFSLQMLDFWLQLLGFSLQMLGFSFRMLRFSFGMLGKNDDIKRPIDA